MWSTLLEVLVSVTVVEIALDGDGFTTFDPGGVINFAAVAEEIKVFAPTRGVDSTAAPNTNNPTISRANMQKMKSFRRRCIGQATACLSLRLAVVSDQQRHGGLEPTLNTPLQKSCHPQPFSLIRHQCCYSAWPSSPQS
jgi:hypothetical protein